MKTWEERMTEEQKIICKKCGHTKWKHSLNKGFCDTLVYHDEKLMHYHICNCLERENCGQ